MAVVDATGIVVGIDFDPEEPISNSTAPERADRSVVILRCMPRAVYVRLDKVDDDTDAAIANTKFLVHRSQVWC